MKHPIEVYENAIETMTKVESEDYYRTIARFGSAASGEDKTYALGYGRAFLLREWSVEGETVAFQFTWAPEGKSEFFVSEDI